MSFGELIRRLIFAAQRKRRVEEIEEEMRLHVSCAVEGCRRTDWLGKAPAWPRGGNSETTLPGKKQRVMC